MNSDIEERIKTLEQERDKELSNTEDIKLSKTSSTHSKIKASYNRKINNLKKYGVENISQLKDVKDKVSKKAKGKDWNTIIEKRKQTNLQRYGKESAMQNEDVKEKLKKTMLEKYGVENAMQDKHVREKVVETNLQRYGCKTALQNDAVKKKIKEDNLAKYHVEYTMQREDVKEKRRKNNIAKYGNSNGVGYGTEIHKQRMLERYGVDNVFKSEFIKKKAHDTMLERYGVRYGFESEDIRNKAIKTNIAKYGTAHPQTLDSIKKKTVETNISRYGVEHPAKLKKTQDKKRNTLYDRYGVYNSYNIEEIRDKAFSNNGHTISKTNIRFRDMLKEELGLDFELEKDGFDLRKDSVVVEIDPSFTHNCTFSFAYKTGRTGQNNPIDKNYHINKTKMAIEKGYKCIHIFDWDDLDKIKNMLKDKKTVYARNLSINEVSIEECDKFLNVNHLQGTCKGQAVRLGLYKDNKLVEIMTFGKPRYNKNYQYELLRLCTDSSYKVVGGSEKLFKHFIENYNPDSIISYCDNSKFSGEVYKRLGFKLKSFGSPSCHWFNLGTKRHITDNLLRQRGFSQLHRDNNYEIAKKGDSNKELMIKEGYVEVYDCGQSTYTWNRLDNHSYNRTE